MAEVTDLLAALGKSLGAFFTDPNRFLGASANVRRVSLQRGRDFLEWLNGLPRFDKKEGMNGLVLAGWRELVRKPAENRRSYRQGRVIVSTEVSVPENFPDQIKGCL